MHRGVERGGLKRINVDEVGDFYMVFRCFKRAGGALIEKRRKRFFRAFRMCAKNGAERIVFFEKSWYNGVIID